MLIVDAHCHAGDNWYEPVEMLIHQMNLNGVEKAALIQYRGNFHNRYNLECAKRFPERIGPVVCVDTDTPDAAATLERWVKEGAVGVRFAPDTRSPGDDPLAIWRKAAQLGIPVTMLGRLEQFSSPEFLQLVEALPECTLIMEHLAGMYRNFFPPDAAYTDEPYLSYKRVMELARFPNTYIKLGGLGEFTARTPILGARFGFANVPPMIDMALEAFGPKRMLWGSDYTPVSSREGYRNALQGSMDYLSALGLSQEDKEWVYGKTAMSVWKLP